MNVVFCYQGAAVACNDSNLNFEGSLVGKANTSTTEKPTQVPHAWKSKQIIWSWLVDLAAKSSLTKAVLSRVASFQTSPSWAFTSPSQHLIRGKHIQYENFRIISKCVVDLSYITVLILSVFHYTLYKLFSQLWIIIFRSMRFVCDCLTAYIIYVIFSFL